MRPLLFTLLVATMTLADDAPKMVPGSADYTRTLKLVLAHKQRPDLEALKKALVALKLPPHPLGCAYVMAPVPAPPPGVPFEPASMPPDWKGTWGEVAMTFWRGDLTHAEYDALHAAAHAKEKGFPDCRR